MDRLPRAYELLHAVSVRVSEKRFVFGLGAFAPAAGYNCSTLGGHHLSAEELTAHSS